IAVLHNQLLVALELDTNNGPAPITAGTKLGGTAPAGRKIPARSPAACSARRRPCGSLALRLHSVMNGELEAGSSGYVRPGKSDDYHRHCDNRDVRSVRTRAVKLRAFGAPLCGDGALPRSSTNFYSSADRGRVQGFNPSGSPFSDVLAADRFLCMALIRNFLGLRRHLATISILE